ncbi:MAG: PQQ-binding-like beta-propeller repeat protein [Candidatus Omnitrophica bacterium]|nr:Outer membrane protein assembly factor BamB [bacterium]NUN98760.1 PQQ-binding-like beta-propeller repeat protein [Candidatus Omnitrophota bacterium]
MTSRIPIFLLCALAACAVAVCAQAADWPFWGSGPGRNMFAEVKGLPHWFDPGEYIKGSEDVDLNTTKNVKWVVRLGSQAYGNPTVAGGKVFAGTNNEAPSNPKYVGDRGVVKCFDEATGKFLWQLVIPKLGAGKVSDWEFLGICSSPAVVGDRVYIMTNRCEVVCLDANGMANGNDGPFLEEAEYVQAPPAAGAPPPPPIEIGPDDADIIWRFDIREELGVFPHNITSSSVLIVGDRVYATTSNGQDWSHVNIPSPFAPALICLDRHTGELLGEEASGISQRMFHCNWSSPAYGEVDGKGMVFFGAGDGFCYAFDPEPVDGPDGYRILKEIWRYDCNPPEHKQDPSGKPYKYPDPNGPCEIIATPVFQKNRIYVAVGQDPEHGDGVGNLSCINAAGSGDITSTGKVWNYKDIRRTMSTCSIADGLLFISDYPGHVRCLDPETGTEHWVHDTKAHIWGSTFVADGKVYIGNEDGILTILEAGKEKKVIEEIEFRAPIYSTPIVANGVLYVGTQTHLYAIQESGK